VVGYKGEQGSKKNIKLKHRILSRTIVKKLKNIVYFYAEFFWSEVRRPMEILTVNSAKNSKFTVKISFGLRASEQKKTRIRQSNFKHVIDFQVFFLFFSKSRRYFSALIINLDYYA
jgi:hypothetical protein